MKVKMPDIDALPDYAGGPAFFPFQPLLAEIEVVRFKHRPAAYSGPHYVATVRVVKSSDPTILVGEERSLLWKYKDAAIGDDKVRSDASLQRMRQFVLAVFGRDPASKEPAGHLIGQLEARSEAEVGGIGRRIHLQQQMVKTKAGRDFTQQIFTPAQERIESLGAPGAPPAPKAPEPPAGISPSLWATLTPAQQAALAPKS